MKNETVKTNLLTLIYWLVILIACDYVMASLLWRIRAYHLIPISLTLYKTAQFVSVPIVIALVFFTLNLVKPKATTWRLAYWSVLPCVISFFFCTVIWPYIYGAFLNLGWEWFALEVSGFFRLYIPQTALLLVATMMFGRFGAYLNSKINKSELTLSN